MKNDIHEHGLGRVMQRRSVLRYMSFVLVGATMPRSILCFAERSLPTYPEMYAHFLGKWVGTSEEIKAGKRVVTPTRLAIKLHGKHDLDMAYTFGSEGDKDFSETSKLLTLLPEKSQIYVEWEGTDKITYGATGLDAFAKTGLGTFTATLDSDPKEARCIFMLSEKQFSYYWQQRVQDGTFATSAAFSFDRVV